MSPYVVGGLIGAGVTILVWMLTTAREFLAEQRQRDDYNRTVLKGALVDYLAALDSLVLEVSDQPRTAKLTAVERRVDSFLDRVGVGWVIWLFARILWRIAYGRRPDELADRMASASAHLRLVAPPQVLALMQELDVLFECQPPYDDAWKMRWRESRERLRHGFRASLDEGRERRWRGFRVRSRPT